jgi:hypothetical protein
MKVSRSRIQVSLSETQRERLDLLAEIQGLTPYELIGHLVDRASRQARSDVEARLAALEAERNRLRGFLAADWRQPARPVRGRRPERVYGRHRLSEWRTYIENYPQSEFTAWELAPFANSKNEESRRAAANAALRALEAEGVVRKIGARMKRNVYERVMAVVEPPTEEAPPPANEVTRQLVRERVVSDEWIERFNHAGSADLPELVREAAKHGLEPARIAELAHRSRSTIYAWLAGGRDRTVPATGRKKPVYERELSGRTVREWELFLREMFGSSVEFRNRDLVRVAQLDKGRGDPYARATQILKPLVQLKVLERREIEHPNTAGGKLVLFQLVPTLAEMQQAERERREREAEPQNGRAPHGVPEPNKAERLLRSLPKDIQRLLGPTLAAGWYADRVTAAGKVLFVNDDAPGKHFSVAVTPSDRRTLQNLRGRLRAVGAPCN